MTTSHPTARGVTARAPGKVNLALVVGPLRDDGFHELVNVFHAVSLVDDVTATPADDVSVSVEGVHSEGVPRDATNLAVRAALLLAERAGVDDGVHLHIKKQIPVAGGMAGGSADAAAALLACDALWQTGMSRDDLAGLAAELGSDVPFALVGGTAVGTGRGERLTPALARGEYEWVVALSETGLSTPVVYGELDRLRTGRDVPAPTVPDGFMQALRSGDAEALGEALENDLQPAACSLAPALERTLEVGREYGALGAMVSGSGPTVAFLVRDHEQALDISVALTASGAADDVRRCRGPVPGARLL
ncbi:4-(cytidine 5'-diphospho)-2-C-methyl-D-erythritol kinase [Kineosporia sp. A_224]|uniref:4-(cytidine 5'-diphospho)-2-C-methyl-D-erythritol kinase n=1 Tax=Kineosporia sp. A_224 TaxID=1962180 RepID=UPI000B4C1E47|nr:4-(cytidine 5'-diphospho)-2-C-methyl-D-erythritol kinase [Kineosporia sp. A_224]